MLFTVTGHFAQNTVHPSRLFSSGVGPKLLISDCRRVVSGVCLGMLKHRSLDNIQARRPLGALGSRWPMQQSAHSRARG